METVRREAALLPESRARQPGGGSDGDAGGQATSGSGPSRLAGPPPPPAALGGGGGAAGDRPLEAASAALPDADTMEAELLEGLLQLAPGTTLASPRRAAAANSRACVETLAPSPAARRVRRRRASLAFWPGRAPALRASRARRSSLRLTPLTATPPSHPRTAAVNNTKHPAGRWRRGTWWSTAPPSSPTT